MKLPSYAFFHIFMYIYFISFNHKVNFFRYSYNQPCRQYEKCKYFYMKFKKQQKKKIYKKAYTVPQIVLRIVSECFVFDELDNGFVANWLMEWKRFFSLSFFFF